MTEPTMKVGEFFCLPRSDETRLGTIWRIDKIRTQNECYSATRVGFVRREDEPYGYDPAIHYIIERRWAAVQRWKAKYPINEMFLLALITDSIDRGATYL